MNSDPNWALKQHMRNALIRALDRVRGNALVLIDSAKLDESEISVDEVIGHSLAVFRVSVKLVRPKHISAIAPDVADRSYLDEYVVDFGGEAKKKDEGEDGEEQGG